MAKPVIIKFMSDINKALRDIDRLERRLDKMNSKSIKGAVSSPSRSGFIGSMMGGGGGLGGVSSALAGLAGSAGNLVTSFLSLNPVIIATTVAFLGIKKLLEGMFKQGNLLEQSKITLKSVLGSERKSVETLRGMREYSRKTQFAPDEVIGPTTMLTNFGVDAFKKGNYGLAKDKHIMDVLGGMATMPGMGGKQLGLDRIINAVIAGRDIRPLKAMGPEALAAYQTAKKAGISGSPEFIRVMLTELAKVPKYLDAANERMNSMQGLWSTITGFTEEWLMDLSGAGEETGLVTFWSQVREILMDIRDAGESFTKYIGPYLVELGAYWGATLKYVWEMLKQIWGIVGPIIIPVFKILVQLTRIIWEIGKAMMSTFISLAKIILAVVKAPFQLIAALTGTGQGLKLIVDELSEFVVGLQVTFSLLDDYMTNIVNNLSKAIDNMIKKMIHYMSVTKKFFGLEGEKTTSNASSIFSGSPQEMRKILDEGTAGVDPVWIDPNTMKWILEDKKKGWYPKTMEERMNKYDPPRGVEEIDKALKDLGASLRLNRGSIYNFNYGLKLIPTLDSSNDSGKIS